MFCEVFSKFIADGRCDRGLKGLLECNITALDNKNLLTLINGNDSFIEEFCTEFLTSFVNEEGLNPDSWNHIQIYNVLFSLSTLIVFLDKFVNKLNSFNRLDLQLFEPSKYSNLYVLFIKKSSTDILRYNLGHIKLDLKCNRKICLIHFINIYQWLKEPEYPKVELLPSSLYIKIGLDYYEVFSRKDQFKSIEEIPINVRFYTELVNHEFKIVSELTYEHSAKLTDLLNLNKLSIDMTN